MRNLDINEINLISGAHIRPSNWAWSAAAGALVGTASLTLTAFSAHPVSPLVALTVGSSMGAGFHAVYDILREYGL